MSINAITIMNTTALTEATYTASQKSTACSDTPTSSDTLTLTGDTQQVMASESYSKSSKVSKSMPLNCFQDSYTNGIYQQIGEKMLGYYKGNCTADDISEYFKSCCKDLLTYYTQQSNTSGTNTTDNTQIILDTYQVFQYQNAEGAVGYGNQYAYENLANSNCRDNYDFMYYSSDLNDSSESMKQLINDTANDLASEWNLGTLDTTNEDQINASWSHGSYNSLWNAVAKSRGCASMIDTTQTPPSGFSFFYEENRYNNVQEGSSLQLGTLLLKNGTQYTQYDVPFTVPTAGTTCTQFFNAGSLVDSLNSTSTSANEVSEKINDSTSDSYVDFLKNFSIYTRWYDCNYLGN